LNLSLDSLTQFSRIGNALHFGRPMGSPGTTLTQRSGSGRNSPFPEEVAIRREGCDQTLSCTRTSPLRRRPWHCSPRLSASRSGHTPRAATQDEEGVAPWERNTISAVVFNSHRTSSIWALPSELQRHLHLLGCLRRNRLFHPLQTPEASRD
jgi:hypothetical protein